MTQIYVNVNITFNCNFYSNSRYESDEELCPCGGYTFRDLDYCALCCQGINCSMCGEYLEYNETKCSACSFDPLRESFTKRKRNDDEDDWRFRPEPDWMKRFKPTVPIRKSRQPVSRHADKENDRQ